MSIPYPAMPHAPPMQASDEVIQITEAPDAISSCHICPSLARCMIRRETSNLKMTLWETPLTRVGIDKKLSLQISGSSCHPNDKRRMIKRENRRDGRRKDVEKERR
jgi:hypothetical protein